MVLEADIDGDGQVPEMCTGILQKIGQSLPEILTYDI